MYQISIVANERQIAIKKLKEMSEEPTETPYIRIAVRLLDGSRLERKFLPTQTLGMLFDFVGGHLAQKMTDETFLSPQSRPLDGTHEVIPWTIANYDLLLNYPKRVLGYSQSDKTFEELGIKDQIMCFLTLRE